MKKAFSYIRFSRPEQLRGDSLRRQLKNSKDWCDLNGYELDESLKLRDLGVSAYKGDNAIRGKLGAFISAVNEGRVPAGSVLIIESLDRLSRQQVPDALELFLGILRLQITIVTIEPPDRFERKTLNEIQLIIVIVILSRAYNESATKSSRIKQAWDQKRLKIDDKPLTSNGPTWLRLVEGKWSKIEENVAIVKRIFDLTIAGYGIGRLVRLFNREGLQTFTGSPWRESSIMKIVHNRAVMGEFTPRHGRGGTTLAKRIVAGDPRPNYFPKIIEEHVFFAAQKALESRTNQRGPSGKNVTNLFTGLLICSEDETRMTVTNKGTKSTGPALVSSGAARAIKGAAAYVSFPYQVFERSFLHLCSRLSPEDLFPPVNLDDKAVALQQMEGAFECLEDRLRTIKRRMSVEEGLDSLIDVVQDIQQKKDDLAKQIQITKAELISPKVDEVRKTQELINMLDESDPAHQLDIRLRIKERISDLVDVIRISIEKKGLNRVLTALIQYKGIGLRQWLQCRQIVKYVRTGAVPKQTSEFVSGASEVVSDSTMIGFTKSTPDAIFIDEFEEFVFTTSELKTVKDATGKSVFIVPMGLPQIGQVLIDSSKREVVKKSKNQFRPH